MKNWIVYVLRSIESWWECVRYSPYCAYQNWKWLKDEPEVPPFMGGTRG